jgi:hypothetical protein
VVVMLAWPRRSLTICRSAPLASSQDAWAWRRRGWADRSRRADRSPGPGPLGGPDQRRLARNRRPQRRRSDRPASGGHGAVSPWSGQQVLFAQRVSPCMVRRRIRDARLTLSAAAPPLTEAGRDGAPRARRCQLCDANAVGGPDVDSLSVIVSSVSVRAGDGVGGQGHAQDEFVGRGLVAQLEVEDVVRRPLELPVR